MIKEKIAALINVKTLVTFAITGLFISIAAQGTVPPEVLSIVTMILGFYFGTQKQKQDDQI